jgi:peptide/nickel transport system permease protein
MLGRCVAARLAAAAPISLGVGLAAALVATLIGTLAGLAAGWSGGRLDLALMRLCDLVLAFPFLLIVLFLAALLRDTGGGLASVVVVLCVVGWTPMARVVRARVLSLRESDLVAAARCCGAGTTRILRRHVLPNVGGTVIALATLAVGHLILAESTLSYLGVGAPPPAASWGRMVAEGQPYMRGAPWLVIAPGVAVLATALGFSLLGDALRDLLDPRGR